MDIFLSELLQVLQQMEDNGILDTQEPHKTRLELWRLQDGTLGIAVYRRKESV